MARKKDQSKRPKIVDWFLKTIGLLIILGIGGVVIYHVMPNSQKRLVNHEANSQNVTIGNQTPKEPKDIKSAFQSLHHDQLVPISDVQVDVDGNVTGSIKGQLVRTHLASVGMVGNSSLFYQQHAKNVQDLLIKVIQPDKNNQYTVKETKNRDLYLFVNGKLFQQTWLEQGLAYVNVPQAYDSESSTLYTAQNDAQGSSRNIWQVNGAVPKGEHGYYWNGQAERDFLNSKKVSFDSHGTSTNFWGKLTKTLR